MIASAGIPNHVEEVLTTHRRDFMKSAGLLLVGFAARSSSGAEPGGPYPDLDFRQLDSWIVIHENNTATFYVGKTDLGQGTGTVFPSVDVRRTRHCVRPDYLHHGQHGHHGRSGRVGRIHGHGARFLAHAARRRRSPPGAARNGLCPPWHSGRTTHRQQRRDRRESRSLKEASPTANSSAERSSTSLSPAPMSTPSPASPK